MENDRTYSWFLLVKLFGWIVVVVSFVLMRDNQEDSISPMLVANTHTRVRLSKNSASVNVTELQQSSGDTKQSLDDSSMDFKRIEAKIVDRLLNGYGSEKDKYIIHSPIYRAGFTNSFRCLIGSIVVSIATGRRLRIDWKELFSITDSSFQKLMYKSTEKIPKPGRTFSDVKSLVPVYRQSSLSKLLHHNVTRFSAYSDVSFLAVGRPVYDEIIKEAGLMSFYNDHHFLLSQLILQPNKELKSVIDRLENQYNLTQCVGIQLRMGGRTATTKEGAVFLKWKTVEKVLKRINTKYDNRTIFLTTDSPSLVPKIKSLLNNHPIAMTDAYEVGHTCRYFDNTSKHTQYLKRAIVDALMASKCNPLYTTNGSSYSRLIYWLSNNSTQHVIQKER